MKGTCTRAGEILLEAENEAELFVIESMLGGGINLRCQADRTAMGEHTGRYWLRKHPETDSGFRPMSQVAPKPPL